MDWLKELFRKAGLDDAKIDEIVTEYNKEAPKHIVPKARYNELAETNKKLEGDLKDRDKQLDDLKKSAGDNAALREQIEKLQTENKAAKDKYEAEVNELRLNTAVKLALSGKVHDPDIVASLLDKSKIELDDAGNIKAGFDDQVKALRESKAFLFVQEDKGGFQFKGTKPPEGSGGGGGGIDKAAEFGKRVAEFAKQGSVTSDAQKSYFGG
ncbi:phage scaffolding protein [Paenibacillus naphthalenovorans]|uniref:phage scaffolding protein n=1 Tax=Paenibacillus naphthalenovorans TaxID=162209 RepID=UPI003D29BC65